jgi:hypothetical protein
MDLATTRALAILRGLGVPHPPAASVRILLAWQACENTPPTWHNPLATTLGAPGSVPVNRVGVQAYPTEAAGIAATVATLQNGFYPGLVAALRTGSVPAFLAAAAEIRTWGTKPSCLAGRLGQSGPSPWASAAVPLALVGVVIGIPWALAILRRR